VKPVPPGAAPWVVYIVEGAGGALYTGITTSLERRFREHTTGARGARFFRLGAPRAVRYVEPAPDRSTASKREAAIKRLTRSAKLALIAGADARPRARRTAGT
jgi:putative endonuclease